MTKLQPAHVDDIAEAIELPELCKEPSGIRLPSNAAALASTHTKTSGVAREAGLKPILIAVPFAVWYAMARAADFLPSPAVTRNQIELMQVDTVASPDMPGFRELGILPQQLDETIRLIVRRK